MTHILGVFSGQPELQILGWTVLHGVWQVGVVAVVLAVLLRATRGASPAARYRLAMLGLAAACGLPLVTGWGMARDWAEHSACWELAAAAPAGRLPEACLDHGLPVADAAGLAGAPTGGPTVPASTAPTGAPADAPLDAPATWWEAASETVHFLSLELTPAVAWLAVAWLVTAALLGLRTVAGWLQVRRLRSSAVRVDDATGARVKTLAARLGIRRPVALRLSDRVDVPAVVGWRRPTILIPRDALTGLAPAAFDAVLAHELGHVRRRDFLVNLVQCAAEAALLNHPAARWICRRIRNEREFCCDDIAISVVPGARAAYARALVALDTLRLRGPDVPAVAVTGGVLLPRIRRLAGGAQHRTGRIRTVAAASLGIALLALPLLLLQPAPSHVSSWAVMEHDIHLRSADPVAVARTPGR